MKIWIGTISYKMVPLVITCMLNIGNLEGDCWTYFVLMGI